MRNYGAARLRRPRRVLTHVFTGRFTDSLVSLGVSHGKAADLASVASSGTGASFSSVPVSMQSAVEQAVSHDFADGMRVVLLVMAGAMVIAFLIALRHPGDRPATIDAETSPQTSAGTDTHSVPAAS